MFCPDDRCPRRPNTELDTTAALPWLALLITVKNVYIYNLRCEKNFFVPPLWDFFP